MDRRAAARPDFPTMGRCRQPSASSPSRSASECGGRVSIWMQDWPTRYARDAVRQYSERALGGSAPMLHDERLATQQVVATLTGYGPLQPFLDDDTIEELWINAPDAVFVARNGVPERTALRLGRVRGARPRRADAAVLGPPRRPQLAVRRRLAARRIAPARRDPGCDAPPLGGQRPQVQPAHPRSRRSGGARQPDARRQPRFCGRRARRREHPRGRRDAERQDDDAQRAARRGAGRQNGS